DSAVAQWSAQAWAKTSRLTGQSFASILQRRVPSHAANSATSAAGTGAWLDTRANLRDVRAIANRGQLEAGPTQAAPTPRRDERPTYPHKSADRGSSSAPRYRQNPSDWQSDRRTTFLPEDSPPDRSPRLSAG